MALARRAVCASVRAGARRRLPALRASPVGNVSKPLPTRALQTSAASCYEVEPSAQTQTPVPTAPWAAKQAKSAPTPGASAPSPQVSSSTSTSRQPARRLDNSEHQAANAQMRRLLRDCAQLFAPGSPLASRHWRERLDAATQRLGQSAERLGASRPTRIGIVGSRSGHIAKVLGAIIDDPLADQSSDASLLAQLQERLQDMGSGSSVLITPDHAQTHQGEVVHLPHGLLKQHNVELIALETGGDVGESQVSNDLYRCDVLVFLVNDSTLAGHARFGKNLKTNSTLRLLRRFATKPSTQIVVDHDGSQLLDTSELERGLLQAIGDDAMRALQRGGANSINHISTDLATHANDALRLALKQAGPLTPPASAWDHFTSLYQTSSVGEVKRQLFPDTHMNDESGRAALTTSSFVLRRALEQALFLIWRDVEYAQQARGAADVLSTAVESERARAHASVFAEADTNDNKDESATGSAAVHERAGDRSKTVDGASKDAGRLVEQTFSSRLPWWKILWKVDDVRAETESSIESAFGKNLEQQLMLETGKLLGVAMRLHRKTRELFSDLDKEWDPAVSRTVKTEQRSDARNPFASPILLNELRKHSLDGVDAKLRADLLTRPIVDRREQLLARGGPVDVLCQRAQRSVMTSVGLTGSAGLLSAVSGVAGSAVGAGMGLPATLSLLALEPATAGASLAFATVFSAWLLQTRWSRAKKRFWRDWERIADGLDDDLKRNLDDVFEKVVAAQSVTAIEGLRALVSGYLRELEDAQRDSAAIVSELKNISTGSEQK